MFHVKMLWPLLTFLFIFMNAAATQIANNLPTGANCITNGKSGICEQLSKCPSAMRAIQSNSYLKICSFLQVEPVVCCIRNASSSTTTRPVILPERLRNKGTIPVHVQKCQEYGKSVFKLVRPPVLVPNVRMQNVSLCARKSKPTIVGGEEASPGEFPHMAIIGYGEEVSKHWDCGGTLISENFVLTAAHCLYHRSWGDAKFVRLGDLNLNSTNDQARPQNFNIIEMIAHPNFTGLVKYNDIALLKLDKNAIFDEYVRPACLSNQNPITANKAIATGWGATDIRDSSDHLLKVNLHIFPYNRCNTSYANQLISKILPSGILSEKQICAGGLAEEKDTCQGDSGGPLQINNDDVYCMYNVIGITSLGYECAAHFIPGIYTRVSAYIPWIEQHVWKS